jgi:PKD repeat protein
MGADQLGPGPATGSLHVWVQAEFTEVGTGFPVVLRASHLGPLQGSAWVFGDGTSVTNQGMTSHVWNAPGVYTVEWTGYNDTYPAGVTAAVTVTVSEAVAYVDSSSAHPEFPYATWETAATGLAEAVDTGTLPGRLVLVTNGVYRAGTVEIAGLNRVALTSRVVVRSMNGPEVTIIEGAQDGVRCAYVGDGAVLSGFTLTQGNADRGGGVFAEGAGMVTNCVIAGNSAYYGGGVSGGVLYECTLTANRGDGGGGGAAARRDRGGLRQSCTLHRCTLTGNSAESGGGTSDATLYDCTLTANVAGTGGGAAGGNLQNCRLAGNSAAFGGGASGATLYNCTLTGNAAAEGGGGVSGGDLYQCTITGNSAAYGGGVQGGSLRNCIVYFNEAPNGANHAEATFEYSCTTPLAPGHGNLEVDPQLLTASHLTPASPCVGTGHPAFASGTDIDGEPWANPPAMGADQPGPGAASGWLEVAMDVDYTHVGLSYPVAFTARNMGPILRTVWDFGDGTRLTNRAFVTHAWSAPGTYAVQLTGYNDQHPAGVSATVLVTVTDTSQFVDSANSTPVFPYATWATAARTIQEAIGAAPQVGGLVLVTDGVYRLGTVNVAGANRVALTNRITVQSVHGPGLTVIEGAAGVRCAWVGDGSVLSGFTLRGGSINGEGNPVGGGALCESAGVVTNCHLTGNSASSGSGAYGGRLYHCTVTGNRGGYGGGGVENSVLLNCTVSGNLAIYGGGTRNSTLFNCVITGNTADSAGGASGGTLYFCTLTGNTARDLGGGSWLSTLYHCVVQGNSAERFAGGVADGVAYNCIVQGNHAPDGPNHFTGTIPGQNAVLTDLYYCCTTPLPEGPGNMDADPRFMDAAAGDFRLRPDSPCIDAGTNLTEFLSTDILGVPRPLDGNGDGVARFDMGAYEFNPYRFGPVLRPGVDGFGLTLQGEPGTTVRVECSRDLVTWELAFEVRIPADGQTLIEPVVTSEPMLFYRAVAVP